MESVSSGSSGIYAEENRILIHKFIRRMI